MISTDDKDATRRPGTRGKCAGRLLALSLVSGIGAAQGAELTVAAGDVAGLIAAINTANANGEADTIVLGGSYTLTAINNTTDGPNGLPSITSEIVMRNGRLNRSAAERFRILHVGTAGRLTLDRVTVSSGEAALGSDRAAGQSGGGIYSRGTLTLHRCVVRNNQTGQGGSGGGRGGDGGGIFNRGSLMLTQSTVHDNIAVTGLSGGRSGHGGGIYNEGTLAMQHSAVHNNRAAGGQDGGGDGDGGGIYNAGIGTVTANHSKVAGNFAGKTLRSGISANGFGGGIYSAGGGQVTLSDSVVTGNLAQAGGGIRNESRGTVDIRRSAVSGNATANGSFGGGGISNAGGALLTDSTVSNNVAGGASGAGGGIKNSGTLTLRRSTVSGNRTSGGFGGGIFNENSRGNITLEYSTVSGNHTSSAGGGIRNETVASLTLRQSTVTNNTGGGGGISSAGTVILDNTMIAGNLAREGDVAAASDCVTSRTFTSKGHNLIGIGCSLQKGATDISDPTDQVGVADPGLGPLADNGRLTRTHALLPGSPALDIIPPDRCAGGPDQRGMFSSPGEACDIGAYEAAAPVGSTGALGSRVWDDRNGNGNADHGEPGLAGVAIELQDGAGAPIAMTISTTHGAYSFGRLPAGNYTVVVTDPPAEYLPTFDVDGVRTTHQATVSLSANQMRGDVDFGYAPDRDGNGAVDIDTDFPALVSSVLPTSRSIQVGTTATAFATIINAGAIDGVGCGLSLASDMPAEFSHHTTNAQNRPLEFRGPIGLAHIAAGNSVQTYLFRLTPTEAFDPTEVRIKFDCANATPAPTTVGLNTLLFSSSDGPVPDIITLAATAQNDSIVRIPGASGAAAFSLASVNVGAGGEIMVSADTGAASLALSIALCETNPADGLCINPTLPTFGRVTTTIDADATPTFSVFVFGEGNVPDDLANNRVFVRFRDNGGVVRGATSVAVRTE